MMYARFTNYAMEAKTVPLHPTSPCVNPKHVRFRHARGIFIVLISAGLQCVYGQQTVSPIEQARLFEALPTSTNTAVRTNGMALADDDTTDDSFGTQVILRSQPRIPTFVVTGDASVFYTNNAALTRRNKIDDAFFVSNAGVSWTPLIAPHLEAQIAAYGSIFRYESTSALDFENLGLGAGLSWNPDHLGGVGLFAHYDFTELLDRHSEEILRDHEFTLGAQKVFPLGRAHAFVAGATLMAGVAEPESAQRDQAILFLTYRLQATRSLGLEFLYRFAGHFYNETDRIDRNQILTASVRYRLQEWADINVFFSFATNRSDNSAFNYDAATTGGGLSATIRF
jgi:hypothetical protein